MGSPRHRNNLHGPSRTTPVDRSLICDYSTSSTNTSSPILLPNSRTSVVFLYQLLATSHYPTDTILMRAPAPTAQTTTAQGKPRVGEGRRLRIQSLSHTSPEGTIHAIIPCRLRTSPNLPPLPTPPTPVGQDVAILPPPPWLLPIAHPIGRGDSIVVHTHLRPIHSAEVLGQPWWFGAFDSGPLTSSPYSLRLSTS